MASCILTESKLISMRRSTNLNGLSGAFWPPTQSFFSPHHTMSPPNERDYVTSQNKRSAQEAMCFPMGTEMEWRETRRKETRFCNLQNGVVRSFLNTESKPLFTPPDQSSLAIDNIAVYWLSNIIWTVLHRSANWMVSVIKLRTLRFMINDLTKALLQDNIILQFIIE